MNKNHGKMKECDIAAIQAMESALAHKFAQPQRIITALTHASVYSGDTAQGADYERMEFLGDRVVNLIVADLLLKTFPHEKEGDLARRHTAFVRGESLAKTARKIAVQDYLRLSHSEKTAGGAENDNILADSMEALIAALYLDAGFAKVYEFIENELGDAITQMKAPPIDSKTALQEWTQARALGLPKYALKERSGPDHAPEFYVSVVVHDKSNREMASAEGKGTSKRAAEKMAAKTMMALLLSQQN